MSFFGFSVCFSLCFKKNPVHCLECFRGKFGGVAVVFGFGLGRYYRLRIKVLGFGGNNLRKRLLYFQIK